MLCILNTEPCYYRSAMRYDSKRNRYIGQDGRFVAAPAGKSLKKPYCSITGCSNEHYARGWCKRHYITWFDHGDANHIRPYIHGPAEDRFNYNIDRDGPIKDPQLGKCWVWTKSTDKKGYARFRDNDGKTVAVHRWSYSHFVGPIPEGMVIDHLCFNPPCANPRHLEPVTNKVNLVERGRTNVAYLNSLKRACRSGHPLTPDNVYLEKAKHGSVRRCKSCRRAMYRSRRLRDVA